MKIKLWGVALLAIPLMGMGKLERSKQVIEYPTVKPVIEYPVIVYPPITLPELLKLSIAEIEALKPEIITATLNALSAKEIIIIHPKILAIMISKIEAKDIEVVLAKLAPQGFWYGEQTKLHEAWKQKDVSAIESIISSTRVEYLAFFIGWGNYQNYEDIDWNRREPFDYRQVLVSSMRYDWQEKFAQQGDIILVVDFHLASKEIFALQELIVKNRDRIKMVILPWGGITVNNYENKDFASYAEIGEWGDRIFYTIKEVAPTVPVLLTVCVTESTMWHWLDSFKAPYDGLAVWNITNTFKAPLNAGIYAKLRERNSYLILSGIFQSNPEKDGWLPWAEVKRITFDSYRRAEDAGFGGIILMGNWKD